jgi:hypothetical protein
MPRLLLFAPCERVLNGSDGSASIIILLRELTFHDVEHPLPPNRIVPMKWAVFAEWQRQENESPTDRFLQKVEMFSQDSKALIPGTAAEFTIAREVHRMTGEFEFFPLVPAGRYELAMSVKRVDDPDWKEVGKYPLVVKHVKSA